MASTESASTERASTEKASTEKASVGATRDAAAGAETTAGKAPGGRAGLKIHHLRPAPGAHTPKTRVGRGQGSKGKTAGRGTQGRKAPTRMSPAFQGGPMPP